ncbi:MAG: YeeE/YedE family protein [Rhodospirillales bacterium]|nr:YeeE/YedE family protein [Rhodospirillales bacterium]
MADLSVTVKVASAAFAAGIALGAIAQHTNFCTMGALSDRVFMNDSRRLRAWFLAIAVAMLGTQLLVGTGTLDLGKAIYLTPNLGWAGAILGGLMFGYGMTMAGGCGNKTLVRLGGGNLKSLVVVLVMGVTAYMTLRGLFALGRVEIENATTLNLAKMGLASQGMPEMIAKASGMAIGTARALLTVILAGGVLIWCFKDAAFRGSPADLAGGLLIGLLIPAGWAITGILGFDDFEPVAVASFTFVAPTAESLQYLMTFTGASINFGIAAVGGVIVGAFLAAKAKGSFHLESFTDANDLLRHLVGATLMGVGGVLAMGCTFGQGITGLSTLALGSLIALVSIVVGGLWGLKALEEGSVTGGLKALLSRA